MTQSALPFDDLDGGRGDGERVDEVIVYSDGGSRGNPGPSAIGAVVLDATAQPPRLLTSVSEYIGVTTNNVAEYQALIAGLRAAAPYRPRVLRVRADSDLIVRQLRGEYRVRQPHLRPLYDEARALLANFPEVDMQHVRREYNVDADALVNAALDAVEQR